MKPVLGHVLRHIPKHMCGHMHRHVPKHMPDRHILARHVPKHMLDRRLLWHVLGLKKRLSKKKTVHLLC